MWSSNETPVLPPGSLWLNVSSAASTPSLCCFLGGGITSGLLHKTQLGTANPWTRKNLSSSPKKRVSLRKSVLFHWELYKTGGYVYFLVVSDICVFLYLLLRMHQQPSVEEMRLPTTSGEAHFPAVAEGPCCLQRVWLHHELCLSGHAHPTGYGYWDQCHTAAWDICAVIIVFCS